MATTIGRTHLTVRLGLAALAFLLLLALAGAAVYVAFHKAPVVLAPPLPATQTLTVTVTPDQLAIAMQGDHFYADYADGAPTTLRLTGSVATVRRQPQHLQLQLRTAVPAAVWCDLGASTADVAVGTTVTVEAPAKQVERLRQPAGVILAHCQLATVP
ncbi:MAG TPA: hypothetical protein VMU89_17155 [Thermomicrobiaceae bacterium]|nr:hypothetical protein [Thermomicrobiaceae bacterium]